MVLRDEPTSSVDVVTEAQIYERLMLNFSDACVISSVHRLHLLPYFDTVILMDQGRIIDLGRPDEVRFRHSSFFAHARTPAATELRGNELRA